MNMFQKENPRRAICMTCILCTISHLCFEIMKVVNDICDVNLPF